LAALVMDLAKIQLMKILKINAHSVGGLPALSVPEKKEDAVRAWGEIAYITVP